MVPPALGLHDQQIEDGHYGDISDMIPLGRADRGEVESRWDKNIDLDATRDVGGPAGKAAVQNEILCPGFSGWLEVISVVRSFDCTFYILRVEFP